jgi:integrase
VLSRTNQRIGPLEWLQVTLKLARDLARTGFIEPLTVRSVPLHARADAGYLKASGLEKEPESPLFPAASGKTGKLSRRPLVRTDAADMLKRRLKQAGLPAHYSPHSFRATGITNFLGNDGTLEAAQRIAGHRSNGVVRLSLQFSKSSFKTVRAIQLDADC